MSLAEFAKKHLPQSTFPFLIHARGTVLSALYSGDKFYCVCCERAFRKLLPGGLAKRENAVCPKCNSYERHRLLWLYLSEKVGIYKKERKLLHVAPEYVLRKKLTALPSIEYIGAGIAAPFADVEMDITAINHDGNCYDAILCNHVLEHVPDDLQAMKELYRVLKPGGWAILQVPLDPQRASTYEDFTITSPAEREKHFGQVDHVRVYGLDYVDRLRSAGFTVKVDSYLDEFTPTIAQRLCLPETEDIYFCTK
jgi:SAM-dependent methyltransferase